MINSRQNLKIKLFASLSNSKSREKNKQFIIEGIHLVQEALSISNDGLIDFVLYSNDAFKNKEADKLLNEINQKHIPTFLVEENLFNKISNTVTPQGLSAVINQDELIAKQPYHIKNIGLALVDIQDPGNLGTILRTANAFGVERIYIFGHSADVFSPKVVRASMGAIFKLPIYISKNIFGEIELLREKGIQLIATNPKQGKEIASLNLKPPIVFLLGNEGQGLSKEVIELCSESGKIPISNNVESLNVAAAAAIVLYEAYKQRR